MCSDTLCKTKAAVHCRSAVLMCLGESAVSHPAFLNCLSNITTTGGGRVWESGACGTAEICD